jgi:dihydroorotate dehydrogenase (NAD+) catalytic subunit
VTVAVGGVRLRAPVMAASGTFGYGTDVPLCDRGHLGGMVSKGIFLTPRPGTPPPRIVETPSGMLNAIGLQGPGVDAVIRDYAPLWATWEFPVLVNVNGETVDEYGELAARLDGVPGVAGLEVNISCPNVSEGGMLFGIDPAAAAAVTAAVRRRTRLPVWVKLTPAVTDIAEIARACEHAGADALCAVNTFVGMSFDLSSGQPRLSFRTGGLSGPAIRPLAVHLAYRVARAVSIPVVGIGGIATAEDAAEFLLAGCVAVQVGTATFVDSNAIGQVVEGLRRYAHLVAARD